MHLIFTYAMIDISNAHHIPKQILEIFPCKPPKPEAPAASEALGRSGLRTGPFGSQS